MCIDAPPYCVDSALYGSTLIRTHCHTWACLQLEMVAPRSLQSCRQTEGVTCRCVCAVAAAPFALLVEFSGIDFALLFQALEKGGTTGVGGDMSIQNALSLASDTLSLVPSYGNREVRVCVCMTGDNSVSTRPLSRLAQWHGCGNSNAWYTHIQVLFIHAALSTCDPGDVFDTLQRRVKAEV